MDALLKTNLIFGIKKSHKIETRLYGISFENIFSTKSIKTESLYLFLIDSLLQHLLLRLKYRQS